MITILAVILIAWTALLAVVVGMLHIATSGSTPPAASAAPTQSSNNDTSTTVDATGRRPGPRRPQPVPAQAA